MIVQSAQAADNSPTATTNALKEKLSTAYGKMLGPIQQVNPSPIAGIYEVITNEQI